jgi:hypothetical protein
MPRRIEGRMDVKKIIFLAMATFAWVAPGSAYAQSTPRSVCCGQMGGQWKAVRSGEMRCFGVDANAYYKCVEQRMSGKR